MREKEKYTDTRFVINGEEGYAFPLVLRMPKRVKTPMPLMVCVQGHSTSMHISLGEVKYESTDHAFIDNDGYDYAACIDERISFAISIGAVCTYESSISSMFHCTCNFVPDRCRLVTGDGGHICYPDITWSALDDMNTKIAKVRKRKYDKIV